MVKNQNKCRYKIGFPPPVGLTNEVFRFRSVNYIISPPAKTGSDNNNKINVIKIDQENNEILFI